MGVDSRVALAAELLRGSGIEIGALHLPLVLLPNVTVRYVDRMMVGDLRAHYPGLGEVDLSRVDVIDDGEHLDSTQLDHVDGMERL